MHSVQLVIFWFAPGAKVYSVKRDAKQVGGNKAELRSAQADQAKDHAIHARQDPSLPAATAYKNGGTDGKNARQVIQPEQHCASYMK
jgi:hypothetical protein